MTVEGKTLLWKQWFTKGIYLVQDELDNDGNFLSVKKFQEKFGLRVNYLHYCTTSKSSLPYISSDLNEPHLKPKSQFNCAAIST